MTPVELFNKWAGDHEWSDWAKPTLFAQKEAFVRQDLTVAEMLAAAVQLVDGSAARTISGSSGSRRAALVVDCPGDIAVAVGILMAKRGFAPVPLFNGVHSRALPLVDNNGILNALERLVDEIHPAGTAPGPAFLLDSRRLDGVPARGVYDNRWIVFPQDFPSGGRLLASGVQDCFILASPPRIAGDLSHVLKRWQEAGIAMIDVSGAKREPVTIATPPWYRHVFYRVTALAGMRPNSFGAFGAVIPLAAAGSSGFG